MAEKTNGSDNGATGSESPITIDFGWVGPHALLRLVVPAAGIIVYLIRFWSAFIFYNIEHIVNNQEVSPHSAAGQVLK